MVCSRTLSSGPFTSAITTSAAFNFGGQSFPSRLVGGFRAALRRAVGRQPRLLTVAGMRQNRSMAAGRLLSPFKGVGVKNG